MGQLLGRIKLGFFFSVFGWADFSVRDLYISATIIKSKSEELVFSHWFFLGMILSKNTCVYCVM
jgi:hypothetical protein